jgi:DNA ligase-1
MLGSKLELDKVPNGIKYATEKYDGCRCLAFIEDGIVELYSRQGKKYEGCKEIEEELLSLGINNVMLDGEILAINCDYDNVYKETTKRLKNKKENKTGLYFMVFDYIEKDEYDKLKGVYSYRERREKLDSIEQTEHIKVAPLLVATENMDVIMDLLDEYRDKGAEGLMVSLDKPYEFKRSKTLLKLKVMSTIDLRVVGFEEGTNKNKGRLGAVLVEYKGNIVKVGSGWKENDRIEIWNNQEKYLGKILEISYFEETTNKDGTYSLRFPIAKRWRFDKDEESYE